MPISSFICHALGAVGANKKQYAHRKFLAIGKLPKNRPKRQNLELKTPILKNFKSKIIMLSNRNHICRKFSVSVGK